jgi:hypothetical protein
MVDTQKRRRPWPNGAEWARSDVVKSAQEAATLLRQALDRLDRAREHLATNPSLAELLIADASREAAEALALQSDIQRILGEAKHGGP